MQNSIRNTIDDFFLDLIILSNMLSEKNSHFKLFLRFFLTFFTGFHAYTLTINSTGSVSKTSDTWWQYRYLPRTCKYRQYRYLVSVSCPSLHLATLDFLTTSFCMACNHSLITRLLRVVIGLLQVDCQNLLFTGLLQVVSTSCTTSL